MEERFILRWSSPQGGWNEQGDIKGMGHSKHQVRLLLTLWFLDKKKKKTHHIGTNVRSELLCFGFPNFSPCLVWFWSWFFPFLFNRFIMIIIFSPFLFGFGSIRMNRPSTKPTTSPTWIGFFQFFVGFSCIFARPRWTLASALASHDTKSHPHDIEHIDKNIDE